MFDVAFPIHEGRTASLETLEQARDTGCWMYANNEMNMGVDDPDFEDAGSFLPGDRWQVAAEKSHHLGVNSGPTVPSSPRDVQIQSMAHHPNMRPPVGQASSF